MHRAALYHPNHDELTMVEEVLRRHLDETRAYLVVTSDAAELRRLAMSSVFDLMLVSRGAERAQAELFEELRAKRPMLEAVYLPPSLLRRGEESDRFFEGLDARLERECEGFSGTTTLSSLAQLIQFMDYAQMSGRIDLHERDGQQSALGFERGALVYAQRGGIEGVEALALMLGLRGVRFVWREGRDFAPNIEAQAGDRLILELMRQRDEHRWRVEGLALEESEALIGPTAEWGGFVGNLCLSRLVDVVQLHALTQSTGVLHIGHGEREAKVYFASGEVVHAQMGRLEAESAFVMIMELERGLFVFEPREVGERTIRASLLNLLLSARDGEEAGGDADFWDDELDLFGAMSLAQERSVAERPASELFERRDLGGDEHEARHPLQDAAGVGEAIASLQTLSGFMWASLVSVRHGVLELVARDDQRVTREALFEALRGLPAQLEQTRGPERIEDMMVLTDAASLICRPVSAGGATFLALALERKKSTMLGMAKLRMGAIEESLRLLAEEAV
jgi:hypothetical protein